MNVFFFWFFFRKHILTGKISPKVKNSGKNRRFLPPLDKLAVADACASEPSSFEMFQKFVIRSIPIERFCNVEVGQSCMC